MRSLSARHPSSDISPSRQQQHRSGSQGQPPPPSPVPSRSQEVRRGLSPRDGEQLHSCSAPLAPPALQLQPILATKDEELTFLWHMLLQSALLHLLSGFVVFKIAEAPFAFSAFTEPEHSASRRISMLSS